MKDHDNSISRSLTSFILRLVAAIRERLREDLALAKGELSSKFRGLALGALVLTVAAVCGVLGSILLVVAGVALLSLVVPIWAAALIFSGAVFIVAAILALVGRSRIVRTLPLVPSLTIEALKEDVRWVRTRLRS